MPQLRGGDWWYEQSEVPGRVKPIEVKSENKPGHRPLESYNLPKWVYHPELPAKRIVVEKNDYFGMGADGIRNAQNWNVAHVAAYHDDLKLLSLATIEQCKEPNKYGMTPAHMTGLGQHPYGPSTAVLYELLQLGVVDLEATNHADQTLWHICQMMHRPANLKKFERVLLKGFKPEHYDKAKEAALRPRGKFARAGLAGLEAAAGSCIVFPGQGSQYVGMLKDLRELGPVKTMLSAANEILGYDILALMIDGPEDKLQETRYCQPAMYIAGLAAFEKLKADSPDKVANMSAVAGLSLGEYTALTVAGVMDFKTGLKLVNTRANAMDFEVTRPGAKSQSMLSVAGLDEDVLEKLCRECAKGETCQIANFLFPKGFSVAGTGNACQELQNKANEAGALQAKMLKTSGAFHTPVMLNAKDLLLTELEKVKSSLSPPQCKVYMNTTSQAIGPDTPAKDIIRMLGEQLVSPVMWMQSMQQAIKDGHTEFIECGPQKQLKAMMKRINAKMSDKMMSVVA